MVELSNHHLLTLTVIIGSGKNHEWVLIKVVGESLRSNDIYTASHFLSTKFLLISKGNTVTLVGKLGTHHLNPIIKFSIT
jgi:hypothetical protein